MKSWTGFALVGIMQTVAPSAHQLARIPRPLLGTEIGVVLNACRQALTGRTFTISFPGRDEGPQFLMRGNGRPARMRTAYGISGGSVRSDGSHSEWHDDFVDIVDYTGDPARRCDGSAVVGELVVTYEHRASTDSWTTSAATTALDWQGTPSAIGGSIFNILTEATAVTSDIVRQTADGRVLRAFTAPFERPPHSARNSYGLGEPPAAATQLLWIDADSLLPVKWEVVVDGKAGYELMFNYKPIDLGPPDGLDPPHCIP